MLNQQRSAGGQRRRAHRPSVAVRLMALLSGANMLRSNPQKSPQALPETPQTLGNVLIEKGEKGQRLPFRVGYTVPINREIPLRDSACFSFDLSQNIRSLPKAT